MAQCSKQSSFPLFLLFLPIAYSIFRVSQQVPIPILKISMMEVYYKPLLEKVEACFSSSNESNMLRIKSNYIKFPLRYPRTIFSSSMRLKYLAFCTKVALFISHFLFAIVARDSLGTNQNELMI